MPKDLALIAAEVRGDGYRLPGRGGGEEAFDEVAAAGWGGLDCAWAAAFWAERSGDAAD